MEVEIRKIEKYFLENKQPKDLLQNINNIRSKDLKEVVYKN